MTEHKRRELVHAAANVMRLTESKTPVSHTDVMAAVHKFIEVLNHD